MKSRIKKTIFVVCTIFLAIFVLELSFRVMYSIKYHNSEYMVFGLANIARVNVNYLNGYLTLKTPQKNEDKINHGFRTAPFLKKKPEGQYRIVAMGGSSTYGLYDGYYESWPYLLESKLRRAGHPECKVINTGVVGQTPYGINRLLISEVFDWSPDMVILYSLYNHTNIDSVALRKEEGRADFFFRLAKTLFYEKSLLVTYLMDRTALGRRGIIRNKISTYRYLLSDIIRRCNEKGVEIIVVKQLINPDHFPKIRREKQYKNISASSQYHEFLGIIDRVCGEYGIFPVDFSPLSPACKGKLSRLLRDNVVHLSDYGKEVLADTIAGKIINLLT